MKILIITFTTGVNPGTFMQALGVQTALNQIWPKAQVEFLKFPDFKRGGIGIRGKKDGFIHTLLQKSFAVYRLLKYCRMRKECFKYSKPVDLFNYSTEQASFIRDYDLVVIGSDTILEKASSEVGQIGLNWMPFDVRKIYFAASASPANFEPKDDLKDVASEALYIGLRDNLTINFFEDKLGIPAERIIKQPDPSYFLDISSFKLSQSLAKKIKKDKKYALYNFNSNFPLRKELADKLRSLDYQVVTTSYNPYADICFDTIDAREWAGVFPLMDIVVTERFHDSVFALRNEKPVIAIDWDPNRFSSGGDSKTLRILEDYGLEEYHFNLADSNIIDSIADAVKRIELCFDKTRVADVNNRIKARLTEVCQLIKSSV